VELSDELAENQYKEGIASQTPNPLKFVKINPIPIVHKLSHQHLHLTFRIAWLSEELKEGIPIAEMQLYPVPVPIANFMETVKNSYF
jgi:A/G-specific adenine glycosylase